MDDPTTTAKSLVSKAADSDVARMMAMEAMLPLPFDLTALSAWVGPLLADAFTTGVEGAGMNEHPEDVPPV